MPLNNKNKQNLVKGMNPLSSHLRFKYCHSERIDLALNNPRELIMSFLFNVLALEVIIITRMRISNPLGKT